MPDTTPPKFSDIKLHYREIVAFEHLTTADRPAGALFRTMGSCCAHGKTADPDG